MRYRRSPKDELVLAAKWILTVRNTVHAGRREKWCHFNNIIWSISWISLATLITLTIPQSVNHIDSLGPKACSQPQRKPGLDYAVSVGGTHLYSQWFHQRVSTAHGTAQGTGGAFHLEAKSPLQSLASQHRPAMFLSTVVAAWLPVRLCLGAGTLVELPRWARGCSSWGTPSSWPFKWVF